ncbi:MAG: VC0807 family protein [Opitutales bacterium]
MPDVSHAPVRENLLLNFGCNLIVPILLLTKAPDWFSGLAPWAVLVVALAFPVGYFFYDLKRRGKKNVISILGMISVVLTGGIGLLKLSPFVFALKETAIPLLFGLFIVGSLKTKRPLVGLFLFNPEVVNVPKLEASLDSEEKRSAFDRLQVEATFILAASFLVSAVLNFVLATSIVTTDPRGGLAAQEAFNSEIGKMTGLSWVVITAATLPITIYALYRLFKGIKRITGLGLEDLMHEDAKAKAK